MSWTPYRRNLYRFKGYRKPTSFLERKEDREVAIRAFEAANRPELRLADNPGNIALAHQVMIDPSDRDTRELLQLVVERQNADWMAACDPFWGNYPPRGALNLLGGQSITLGCMPTGDYFCFPIGEHEGHVGIHGPTRRGKTNIIKIIVRQAVIQDCCVVVMTHKPGEFSGLIGDSALQGRSRVLRWTDLMLAFLEPPPGVPRLVWAVQVVDIFARTYGLFASRRLMLGAITSLYGKNDLEPPNLWRLARYIKGFETGAGFREQGYKESITWTLSAFMTSTSAGDNGSVLNYSRSDFLQRLFSKRGLTVIEGHGLPTEHFAFLIAYMMLWLYMWRLFGGPRTPKVKLVIDDATLEIDAKFEGSGWISPLDELFIKAIALGIEIYYANHCFGRESDLIRQNTATHLFVGARENFRLISEVFGLTPEQCEKLRILMLGELMAFSPDVWPKPVYAQVKRAKHPSVSEELVQVIARAFLSGVTAKLPGEAQAQISAGKEVPKDKEKDVQKNGKSEEMPQRNERSAIESRILITAAQEWGLGLLELYKRCQLSARDGRKAIEKMEAEALIRVHSFPGKGRGGRIRVIEVTDRGWERLQEIGIQREKPLTHGGWEHELAARLIGTEGRRVGRGVEYEVSLFDRRFDVVWTSKTGQKTFFEVELSDISHAVEGMLKAMQIPGVTVLGNRLVVVVRDRKDAERARKLLAKKGCRTEEDGVILIRCISDYYINISGRSRA
jgi:hypothetical protein